jgi:hypothetical protein
MVTAIVLIPKVRSKIRFVFEAPQAFGNLKAACKHHNTLINRFADLFA